jgi:hypothetical protein
VESRTTSLELLELKCFFLDRAQICPHALLVRRKFPEIGNQTGVMKLFLLAPLVFMPTASAVAGEASYVYCDNGLRCVKAPCPSNNALDLAAGAVMKGVSIDTERLPGKDRTEDLRDKLYAGTLVLKGFIERRTVTYTGKDYSLPYLVATSVERAATPAESARCGVR